MNASDRSEQIQLEAAILAGGEGLRLRPLTRRITGQDTPKHFCPIIGTNGLLEQTCRALAFSERATVTVLTRGHQRFYEPLMAGMPRGSVVIQPRTEEPPQRSSMDSCPLQRGIQLGS